MKELMYLLLLVNAGGAIFQDNWHAFFGWASALVFYVALNADEMPENFDDGFK